MGSWLNVAFIQTDDLGRVEHELRALVADRGRRLVQPAQRTPDVYDPMQYGKSDEVRRWGIAGFPGAPGWTVLRTAPFELLLETNPPLLAQLAGRLRVPAFQYNLYDGTSRFLFEVDRDGRIEKSGFVGGSDPCRYWDAAPPEDRIQAQFRVIDSPLALESASETAITASFGGANSQYCDNRFLVEVLVPHAPMQVDGFLFYADAS